MNIELVWREGQERAGGLAIYAVGTSTYEVWLPSLERARVLEQLLRGVYEEGKQVGQREIARVAIAAMQGAIVVVQEEGTKITGGWDS